MITKILFCFVLITSFGSYCQIELTGSVTDAATGEPIPFTKIGTVNGANVIFADQNGFFTILVNENDSIAVKAPGYEMIRFPVLDSSSNISIRLQSLNRQLDILVITALGLARNKRDLGYSVQRIETKELTNIRNPNVINSFAGRIAGVQTTNGSSGIGSSARIVIRGETSLSGNNQPLFVVDGVPVSNDFIPNNTENLEGGFQEVDYGNAMGDFSSDDIESITVLKGPGAAALYGSRAANGVIVIETKNGASPNGFSISFNSALTFEQIAFLPDFQNVYGQGAGGVFAYEDGLGGGIGDGGLTSFGPQMNGQLITQYDGPSIDINGNKVRGGDVIARNGNPISPTPWTANPDNVRNFFQTGVTSQQNISISSGTISSNYRFSFSRMDNTGTIPNTDYTRNNVAFTAHQSLTKRLQLRTFVNYINSSSNHRPSLGYGSENNMYSFLWMGRQVNTDNAKEYWQAGQKNFNQFNYNTQWLDNPYFSVYENTNAFSKNRMLGNVALTYSIAENWSLRLRSGLDSYHDLRQSKRAFSTQRFKNGAYREDEIDFTEINTDVLLSYQQPADKKLRWNAALGANNFTQKTNYKSITAGELSVPDIYNFGNSKIPLVSSQYNTQKQINSVYGIFGINYNRYLYLDVNVRNDWSTTLPNSNNSFAYYSTSIAFVLSEIISLPKWFSYAKLRASTASVGNDTDPYQLYNTYAFNQNYGSFPLLTNESTLLNEDLKPERINALEAGAELYFLNDRIGLDLSVYRNTAVDQIISVPASASSGYTNRIINGGKIQSRGIEVAITGNIIKRRNIDWTIFTNFSKGASFVLELPEGIEQYTTGYSRVYTSTDNSVYYIARPDGGRIGDMYGTGFEKTEDGQIIYDENGFPIRSSELRYLGNYNPDFILGVGSKVRFKNLTFNLVLDWRQGGTIVSRTKAIGSTSGVLAETLDGREEGIIGAGVVNVGTDENPIYEKNTTAISAAEYYNQFYNRANEESSLYSATYLKIRQIGLTYSFPDRLTDKMKMDDFSISIIGSNLFTWTENPHIDPELSAMQGTQTTYGVEDLSYPSTRSLGFKVQFKF